jgi:hypothetical protein
MENGKTTNIRTTVIANRFAKGKIDVKISLHFSCLAGRCPLTNGPNGRRPVKITGKGLGGREPCNESMTCHFGKNGKRFMHHALRQYPWETVFPCRCNPLRGVCGGSAMHRIFSCSAMHFSGLSS